MPIFTSPSRGKCQELGGSGRTGSTDGCSSSGSSGSDCRRSRSSSTSCSGSRGTCHGGGSGPRTSSGFILASLNSFNSFGANARKRLHVKRFCGGRFVDSEDENEALKGLKEIREAEDEEPSDEDEDDSQQQSSDELPEYWKETPDMRGSVQLNQQAPHFSLVTSPPGDQPPETISLATALSSTTNAIILVFTPIGIEGSLIEPEGGARVLLDINREMNALETAGARVLAINKDQPFANRVLAQRLKLRFPILSDMSLKVSSMYVGKISYAKYLVMTGKSAFKGVRGFRTSNLGIVVIDALGRVIYKWVATMPRPSTNQNIPAGAPYPAASPNLKEMKRVIVEVCQLGKDVMKANGYISRKELGLSTPADLPQQGTKRKRNDLLDQESDENEDDTEEQIPLLEQT
eukprot:CAMPEP_0184489872 /NCGR_PEP_ID=MMETSP0113_2-20130426/16541_1 /TAXON_ID=91329 /ORGANISM="Norrisiella sphaerica, Strain BC52" /LENGTH=404 /DNA_ID=CAMNT_0026873519 /DNA_START=18 /DNA_END=1232 /DNA_ORIENTATION=+